MNLMAFPPAFGTFQNRGTSGPFGIGRDDQVSAKLASTCGCKGTPPSGPILVDDDDDDASDVMGVVFAIVDSGPVMLEMVLFGDDEDESPV